MESQEMSTTRSPAPGEIEVPSAASLIDVLDASVQRFAARPAYHNLGVTLTFADLDRLSRQFAGYLQGLGLAKGERIAVMLPNVLQYPISLFGALRAGLTVVNTNPLYTPRELRHQLADSGATAIVVLENFAHVLAQVRADTQIKHIITCTLGDLARFPKRTAVNFVVRRIKHLVPPYHLPDAVPFRQALHVGAARQFRAVSVVPQDLAFLQYTGGTTGVAKGAMLTHGNLVANLSQMSAFLGHVIEDGREVMIAPLPLYHVFCLTCDCLLFMKHGGLNVLITNPRDIPAFVAELRKWRFSMFTGVNTLYAVLLDRPEFARLDFSHLKLGVAGGMALHPRVAQRWQAITGRPLIEGYGLTECSPVVAACSPYEEGCGGTVGRPLPGTQISIRDGDSEVSAGQAGELWVRGPQVMAGYWANPAETAKVLTPDGWLRTGDIAVQEPDGFLRIVDRQKDLIIVSGFKVFPNEVECVVGEHPAVLECGCVGVPDPRSGQAVKIFIVLRPGFTLPSDELQAHCRERLTAYKVPKHVELCAELPKSHIGKVLRRALRADQPARAA
jgi:long-chain acyl-CoA synthetase